MNMLNKYATELLQHVQYFFSIADTDFWDTCTNVKSIISCQLNTL